jgi:hypothetical protein
MSYSRWSNSRWYTYHDCASGDTKGSQVFNVCGVQDFTFDHIESDILGCAKLCCENEKSHNTWWKGGGHEAQYWELVALMATFMADISESFNPSSPPDTESEFENLVKGSK